MADRPKLRTMAARSLALGKPQAAAAVLQRVLQSIPHDAGRG
jgi:hypothetical protein